MVYIIPVVCIILCAFAFWGASKLFDRDRIFVGIIAVILGGILVVSAFATTINAVAYVDYKINEVSRIEKRIEEYNVLTTMLGELSYLIAKDVTASDTYLHIYNEVIDFNKNVREANTWANTIWEGILCDPSYAKLDIIPLN